MQDHQQHSANPNLALVVGGTGKTGHRVVERLAARYTNYVRFPAAAQI